MAFAAAFPDAGWLFTELTEYLPALTSQHFNSTLFGLISEVFSNDTLPPVCPLVLSSSLPTSSVKEVVDAAFDKSVADVLMSVGWKEGIIHALPFGPITTIVLLAVSLAILTLLLRFWIEEHTAGKDAQIIALRNTIARCRRKQRGLIQELSTSRSDLIEISTQVYNLRYSKDKLQASFDDLKHSFDILARSLTHLENHNKTIEARNEDIDQENKILWHRNASLSQENANLRATWAACSASYYGLTTDHTALQTLYAQTFRQNSQLKKDLSTAREISAHNARSAAHLASTALHNAESRIAALEAQMQHSKHLEEENARLLSAASVRESWIANKDIEVFALRMEIGHQEKAHRRLEKACAAQSCTIESRNIEIFALRTEVEMQGAAIERLVRGTAEKEDTIDASDNTVLFQTDRAERAERKLAWHRFAFEQAQKHAHLEVDGFKEPPVQEHIFEARLESRDFDAFLHTADASDGLGWTFGDIPGTTEDAQEEARDLAATIVPAERESKETGASEEDLDDFSYIVEEASVVCNDNTAAALVLTESESLTTDLDFESIVLSGEESDVKIFEGVTAT
ncbi:hypothetical protein E8E12_009223 [Didymella heteroderae]|uniref:Uncharacterized protein n=1 Tax=Didymella heteroderae TaxID=1769908 RepID=A0A9P4WZE6_9PLEO|nr:hypothetical protein E8E12_009223 [Didymella heteroderae]